MSQRWFTSKSASVRPTLFEAVAALLSAGLPLASEKVTAIRVTMKYAGVNERCIEQIVESCREGVPVERVRFNPDLLGHLTIQFAAALTLLALRHGNERGDALGMAGALCSPYFDRPDVVQQMAAVLRSLPDATPTGDLVESLRLLCHPSDQTIEGLRRLGYLGGMLPKPRRSVAHVTPHRIQHPEDREATQSMQDAAGLGDLVAFVMKHGLEKMERVSNLGGRVQVGPDQFPDLYGIFQGCVARSGVRPEPDLYVENGMLNAYTYGSAKPYIVLQTATVAWLDATELEFVIGHELGHIRFGHVQNLTLGRMLPRFASHLPFGTTVSAGLDLALFNWERKAEFSADRMGLLVCQDVGAALSVMMKLSGVPLTLYDAMNVEAFVNQYESFRRIDDEATGAFAKLMRSSRQTHPWTVVRAHEIKLWASEGPYEELVANSRGDAKGESDWMSSGKPRPYECAVCNTIVAPDSARCGSCGAPVTERNRMQSCSGCGAHCRSSLNFCEQCGKPLSNTQGVRNAV